MVSQLLALKDLVDRVAVECFQRNERFLLSIKESFEFFINERPNKPAEMLGTVVYSILLNPELEYNELIYDYIIIVI